MTRGRRVRTVLGLLLLAVSVPLFVWGVVPARRETRLGPVVADAGLGLPEPRSIKLVFPPRIRAGDTGVVRLNLDGGLTGQLTPAAGDFAPDDFYRMNNVIVESRFDLPGIYVRPSELISAPISPGQSAVFYWTLRPDSVGRFRGTVWLYLRVVDKLTGVERREAVSAQVVEIESVRLLGLPVDRVCLIGLGGVVLGLFLSLPLFEDWIATFVKIGRKM